MQHQNCYVRASTTGTGAEDSIESHSKAASFCACSANMSQQPCVLQKPTLKASPNTWTMLVNGMELEACAISSTPATVVRPGSANSGSSSTLRRHHAADVTERAALVCSRVGNGRKQQ